MSFVEAVAVMRRHKLLVYYGGLVAVLMATFAAYRFDGTTLVSRTPVVYESSAVVAVRPGAEQPTTTLATVPPTTVPPRTVAPSAADPNTPTTSTVAPTTVPIPPLAPLSAVVDSRAMYYTALSLRTVVISPGFSEAVRARAPETDGSVTAVVAQDTNTMDIVVTGSTPAITTATMTAALAELQSVVAAYSATPATRFSLDGVVISAPSVPHVTTGIKDAMTFALVFAVAVVLWWFIIRALDTLQLHRRATTGGRRRRRRRGTPHDGSADQAARIEPASPSDRTPVTVGANGDAAGNGGVIGNVDGLGHDGGGNRPAPVPVPASADALAAPPGGAVATAVADPADRDVRPVSPTSSTAVRSGRRDKQGSARVQ